MALTVLSARPRLGWRWRCCGLPPPPAARVVALATPLRVGSRPAPDAPAWRCQMKRATLALALTLATATAVSAGQKPGQGNPHSQDKHAADKHAADKHDGDVDDRAHVSGEIRFSTGDARLIHEGTTRLDRSRCRPVCRRKSQVAGSCRQAGRRRCSRFPSTWNGALGRCRATTAAELLRPRRHLRLAVACRDRRDRAVLTDSRGQSGNAGLTFRQSLCR